MKKLIALVLAVGSICGLTACGKKKANIIMWTGFGTSITDTLTELLDEFTKETGITVAHESKGGYENLKSAVVYEMGTGNTPNVVLGYPDHFAEYISGESLLPLDSFIKKEDKGFLDDFVQAYLPENRSFGDDLIYGLPFNKSSEVLVYNKTFFDFYNIEVPTTWQELETTSKQIAGIVNELLAKEDNKGIVGNVNAETGKVDEVVLDMSAVTNFAPFCYDSQSNFFITTTRQWGGVYTAQDKTLKYEKGYVKFNNPQTKEAMAFFDKMSNENLFATPSYWEANYGSDAFKVMKCVMTVGSSAGVSYNIPSGDTFEIGVAPIMYNADNADEKWVIQQGTNIGMMANSTKEQKEQAWKLIKFLTSSEINTRFALETGYLPVRESGLKSEAYQKLLNYSGTDVKEKLKAETAKVVFGYKEAGFVPFVDPAFIGSAGIRAQVELMVDAFIVDTKTVEEAFASTLTLLVAYKDPNEK